MKSSNKLYQTHIRLLGTFTALVLLIVLTVLGLFFPYQRVAVLEQLIGDTPSKKALSYIHRKNPTAKDIKVEKVIWWNSCCEPRLVEPLNANAAQVTLSGVQNGTTHTYYVDVRDAEPEENQLGFNGSEIVRKWTVVEGSIDTPQRW